MDKQNKFRAFFSSQLESTWRNEERGDEVENTVPYKPYNPVDGRILTAVYGVDPYRNLKSRCMS